MPPPKQYRQVPNRIRQQLTAKGTENEQRDSCYGEKSRIQPQIASKVKRPITPKSILDGRFKGL
jgi:hypothetical protein